MLVKWTLRTTRGPDAGEAVIMLSRILAEFEKQFRVSGFQFQARAKAKTTLRKRRAAFCYNHVRFPLHKCILTTFTSSPARRAYVFRQSCWSLSCWLP